MAETSFSTPTALEAAGILAASIAGKRHERLEKRSQEPPWKPRRNYASGLSSCVRQMTYAHTHWDQKEPFGVDGVAHMEDGTHEERLLIQELLTDGFEVVEEQVKLDDDKYWVTGKIDGKLAFQGRRIPFEVKRVSPYAFDQLNSVDDFKRSEFDLKKLKQLTLYLLLHNQEVGLFILSNGIGGRKVIVVPLDYQLGETILKSLDATNAALKVIGDEKVDANDPRLPSRIPYHSKICGYCPWKRVCLPDMAFGEGAVMGDAELTEAVTRFATLKPSAAEYEKLKKSIAASVKDKPLVVAGDYLVTGAWAERTVKAQPERVDRYWKWEIESKAGTNGAP